MCHPECDGATPWSRPERLEAAALSLDVEGDVVCCYARQDKHWVTGPDGQRWENYVVLADAGAELEGKSLADVADQQTQAADGGCCAGQSWSDSGDMATSSACCA